MRQRNVSLAFIGHSSQHPFQLPRGQIDDFKRRTKLKPCPSPTKRQFVHIMGEIEYRIDVDPIHGGYCAKTTMPIADPTKGTGEGRSVDLAVKALQQKNPGTQTRQVWRAR